MYTNIVIKENANIYNYLLQYNDSFLTESSSSCGYFQYPIKKNEVGLFLGHDVENIKIGDNWNKVNFDKNIEFIPDTYYMNKIRLFFPLFSADVYNSGLKYGIVFSTFINGKKIILGSEIFDKSNALASPPIYMNGNEYYEYLDFFILDPFHLIYDDDWKDFRTNVCGEKIFDNQYQLNNTGSILYVSLHVIEYDQNLTYVNHLNYIGGQNSFNIIKNPDNLLNLSIETNVDKKLSKTDQPSILCKINYNEVYTNLAEYLLETYQTKEYSIYYDLVIGNQDDLYINIKMDEPVKEESYCFSKSYILGESQNFQNMTGWKEGIFIICSANIIIGDEVITLMSNKIPLTLDLLKFFVKGQNIDINSINLDTIDMNIYKINAVNKTINNIVQISKQEDSKNKLIQPVFFRSIESGEIILHTQFTENICINLDNYKSKVNRFVLQIEGINFTEIGRTQYGILFKIIGKKLPHFKDTGTYYILDENSYAITNGKYIYDI